MENSEIFIHFNKQIKILRQKLLNISRTTIHFGTWNLNFLPLRFYFHVPLDTFLRTPKDARTAGREVNNFEKTFSCRGAVKLPRKTPFLVTESFVSLQDKTHLQRVLNQWYGSVKQCWKLIYRASTDGFSAESFHRHCDGVSPTYVLVLVIFITRLNITSKHIIFLFNCLNIQSIFTIQLKHINIHRTHYEI